MDFFTFCTCGGQDYALLKRRVDACAPLGRSYEFSPCAMPPGCRPHETQMGFWRAGTDYLLYFRPAVTYAGTDPRLRAFFDAGPMQRFADFPALAGRLRALAGDAPPRPALRSPAGLEAALKNRVVGQDRAAEAAAFRLWGHLCKREPLRPLSLLFYGPTGVGKSELAKSAAPALNACLGENRYQTVWTELNTFTQAHSVYRLTGAPPGYVGYDDPPVLEAVRQCPYTVFVFDELDKAHPEVLKVLMSVLDEGRCAARRPGADGARELDFRRCVLLFTSNFDLSGGRRLGFAPAEGAAPAPVPSPGDGLALRLFQSDEEARAALIRQGVLREIAGRLGGLIGFSPLSDAGRWAVTARQIAALGREFGVELTADPELARALTPDAALSPRSTVPILEGLLTPLLAAVPAGSALRLGGTADRPVLLPA